MGDRHFFKVLRDPGQPLADGHATLSTAERLTLSHAIEGRTPIEIAGLRGVALNTVYNQFSSIYRKLDVPSLPQAALWAARHVECCVMRRWSGRLAP